MKTDMLKTLIRKRIDLSYEMLRRLAYEDELSKAGVAEDQVQSVDVKSLHSGIFIVGVWLTKPDWKTKQKGWPSDYRHFETRIQVPRS